MKVYIAHNFSAAVWIKEDVVPLFKAAGIEVTSSWLDIDQAPELLAKRSPLDDACQDLKDIDRADAVVFFCDQHGPTPGRGKYFELGYALGKKPVVMIGSRKEARNCVFCSLFPLFPDVPAAIARLKSGTGNG